MATLSAPGQRAGSRRIGSGACLLGLLLHAGLACTGDVEDGAQVPANGSSSPGDDPASGSVPRSGTSPAAGDRRPDGPAAAVCTAPTAAPVLTRLTAQQYTNTVAALLGAGLALPDLPADGQMPGFLSLSAAHATVGADDFQAYMQAAYSIAAQVFHDSAKRAALVKCTPASVDDRACASSYVRTLARRAWRRPVADEELSPYVDGAVSSARRYGDPWAGLQEATAALLTSPNFLVRVEGTEPDASGRCYRFDGFAMASRLSFLLLDTGPSDALLALADSGQLSSREGVRAAAVGLLADARSRKTLSRFLVELLDVDDMARVTKDAKLYPMAGAGFGASLDRSARAFLDDVVGKGASLSDLLRSRDVFVDATLAKLYELPAPRTAFQRVSLVDDTKRAGFLGQVPFLALRATEIDTSPTRRGISIQRALLCHEFPPPPPDVNPVLPDPPAGQVWTRRERSEQIMRTNPCGSCHGQIEPLGFPFEGFDAIGRRRDSDSGKPVDVTSNFDGVAVNGAVEMAAAVAARPDLAACAARQLFRYATGMFDTDAERPRLDDLGKTLAGQGLALASTLPALIESDLFRYPAGLR